MTTKLRKVLVVLSCSVALVALSVAPAGAQGVSQFIAGVNYTEWNVYNPDEFEYLAIAIAYDDDGSLQTNSGRHGAGCAAALIPPHGNDDREIFDEHSSTPDTIELIAVPTEGPHAGVFDRTASLGLGVYADQHEQYTAANLPPRVLAPPTDSGDRDDLMGCICCELDRLGLPPNALQGALGLNCPDAEGTVTCDPPPA